MTKIALLVGIDDYQSSPLAGCVSDANHILTRLCRHYDNSPNFECRVITAPKEKVTRASLKQAVEDLFTRKAEVALFFFAGHGTVNNLGGYLVTQDATKYDEGLAMTDLLTIANQSPARERIIILDCCHSGALGQLPVVNNDAALLKEGVSILSACRESEASVEDGEGGLFTSLVCDALNGGAADVCGKVTVAGIYAYVDEALGGWDQRPLFKIHVSKLVPLRNCPPSVGLDILRMLPEYFKRSGDEYPLDPSYESTVKGHNPDHVKIFGHLQSMRAARLVTPVGEEHLYFAAMNSKSCRLTALGVHYWHLANSGKI
ncbi:caspase family protein [Dehalococcoides mccartyi]